MCIIVGLDYLKAQHKLKIAQLPFSHIYYKEGGEFIARRLLAGIVVRRLGFEVIWQD